MSDRREEILKNERKDLLRSDHKSILSAMDEYMKECCLHLLEYMATLEVECYIDDKGDHVFYMRKSKRDIILTKEQLFENFL